MDNVVYADCVLINGKVATVDAHFSFKRAIAVKQGWIINVGEDQRFSSILVPRRRSLTLAANSFYPPRMTHISISAGSLTAGIA